MQLAWPTDHTICALIQDKQTSSALAINTVTGAARMLVQAEGGQWIRMRQWPGADPIAAWAAGEKKCFRLSALGQSEEVSVALDHDRARPSTAVHSYFDDEGVLWMDGVPDRDPAKLAQNAGASCWAPDASILLYAKKRELWSVWSQTLEQRPVMGSALDNAGLEANAPCGMSWSGDGGAIAYWRQSGVRGQVRRAYLGLEEVIIRARFDKGVEARTGQSLWIAKKLYFDQGGAVKEPVWETVKGEFAVRKTLAGPDETVIEAISIGGMPGVLARIAGRSEPDEGIAPGTRSVQFWLKPIPDMIAWLHGTKHAGELIGVEVRRTPLGAPDS